MGRYILKFTKEKRLKYISHLDVLRLFQRAFKRAGIRLSYSQGYNPHAKVGFALPLSLGFESSGEYMEIETGPEYSEEEIKERLNAIMPDGIEITSCGRLAETSKTAVAAALDFASYKILFTGEQDAAHALEAAVKPFMKQEKIITVKFSKKKKKNIESDIRPHIRSVTTVKTGAGLMFSMMLATGSRGNLNPETLVEELCRYAGVEYSRPQWAYRRMEMYYLEGRNDMIPLSEFKG